MKKMADKQDFKRTVIDRQTHTTSIRLGETLPQEKRGVEENINAGGRGITPGKQTRAMSQISEKERKETASSNMFDGKCRGRPPDSFRRSFRYSHHII